jgi:hypothetical protein
VIQADEARVVSDDESGFDVSARLLAETSASSGFSARHAATRASLLFAVGFESGEEETLCLILRRGPRFRRPTGPSGPFDLRLPSRSRHVGSSSAGSGTPLRVAGATVDRRGAARRPPEARGDVADARTHAVADRTANAIARRCREVRVRTDETRGAAHKKRVDLTTRTSRLPVLSKDAFSHLCSNYRNERFTRIGVLLVRLLSASSHLPPL